MKKLIAFCFMFFAVTAFAQTPDTLTPEKNARWKIGKIRDNTVRAITPQDFRNAFNSVANLAVKRVPYLTQSELRAGKADTASVVQVAFNNRIFTYRYDATSTAVDDSVRVIRNGTRRYVLNSDVITPRMYGAKGDGTTDDTQAIQKMLNRVADNTTIDFQEGTYVFTSVSLTGKKGIAITGKGAVLQGTLTVGSTSATDPSFLFYLRIGEVKFDLSSAPGGSAAITLSNAQDIEINNVVFKGGDKAVFVQALDKSLHTARVKISSCRTELDLTKAVHLRGVNYFLYVDNLVKTSPYTGIKNQIADFAVTGNLSIFANVAHVVGYGIDGITISNNTFFHSGGFYKSQIKEQNIRLACLTWTKIIGNDLFESGYEAVLLDRATDVKVIGNNISWPGQRDVTRGYGIKLTGAGQPVQPTYTNSVINANEIALPTRSGIAIDSGSNYVIVATNQIIAAGNVSHYYGTGTAAMGDASNIPLINSVAHYAIENSEYNLGVLISGNTSNENSYLLPVNETVDIYKRSRQSGNISVSGIVGSGTRPITDLSTGIVDGSNVRVIELQVASGTINTINGVQPGEVISLYNGSGNVTLTNNSTTMLLSGATNAVIPFRGVISLLKQVGGFKEISRTFGYSTPTTTETLTNKTLTTPTINGVRMPINQTTKTADYTVTATDYTLTFNSTAAPINVPLPDPATVYANGAGAVFVLKKLDNSANAVTVVGTIDNNTNYALTTQNQSVAVQSNGIGYKIVAAYP